MYTLQRARETALSYACITKDYTNPDEIVKVAEIYLRFLQGVQHQPSERPAFVQVKGAQKVVRSSFRKR